MIAAARNCCVDHFLAVEGIEAGSRLTSKAGVYFDLSKKTLLSSLSSPFKLTDGATLLDLPQFETLSVDVSKTGGKLGLGIAVRPSEGTLKHFYYINHFHHLHYRSLY